MTKKLWYLKEVLASSQKLSKTLAPLRGVYKEHLGSLRGLPLVPISSLVVASSLLSPQGAACPRLLARPPSLRVPRVTF